MAPQPSKTTSAWWLASNLTNVRLSMKCHINNQWKPDLPQHKPGSPWAKLIATYNFAASPLFPLHDLCSCSCAKVLILTQLPFAVEMWVKWAKEQTQLGRTLVPCCQYNFNSGILASGKTKMASKPSKTTEMSKQQSDSANNPQHKPGSPWENWSLPTTSQLRLFCITLSLLG